MPLQPAGCLYLLKSYPSGYKHLFDYTKSRWVVGLPAFVLLTIKREDTDLAVWLYASLLHLINLFDSLLPQHII